MFLFITGMGAGAVTYFAATAWIASLYSKQIRTAISAQPYYRALLVEARRYLGQIASCQSINEAHKIANKALNKTEIGK